MPIAHVSALGSEPWRQAYTALLRDYLSRGFSAPWEAGGRTSGEFIYYDIDKDGVPELIVADSFHFTSYLAVYTFRGGRVVQIDQPGVIVNGRTLAPLRFVAESFGGAVVWDGSTRTASITT